MTTSTPHIFCNDQCGASTLADAILGSGWEYLHIQARYRCVDCWRKLNAVKDRGEVLVDTHVPFVDLLPKDSRGALKKETASTISATSVKP